MRKETEITFFREIWPDDHDLARKKPKFFFSMKFDSTAISYPKITKITFIFVNLTRRSCFSTKKIEIPFFRDIWHDGHKLRERNQITFFHESWPDDHDLREKNRISGFPWDLTRRPLFSPKKTEITFFHSICPTTMCCTEITQITFFRELLSDNHDLAWKNRNFVFFMKFDLTAMI
jgi:hypothetical protein